MERRSDRINAVGPVGQVVGGTRGQTVVDARTSLALWLRAARGERGLTLDDIARVTKIQPRILERLEAGKSDGLPADVFVRGFVRSFAKCVGLDEAEALKRYLACAGGSAPVITTPVVLNAAPDAPRARAVVAAMSDLAPVTARSSAQLPVVTAPVAPVVLVEIIEMSEPVGLAAGSLQIEAAPVEAVPVEAVPVESAAVESAPVQAKAKKPKKVAKPRVKKGAARVAAGTPFEPSPVVVEAAPAEADSMPAEVTPTDAVTRPVYRPDPTVDVFAAVPEPVLAVEASAASVAVAFDISVDEAPVTSAPTALAGDEPATASAPWQPTMPALPTVATPPRRSFFSSDASGSTSSTARSKAVVPSLVIDDADPDSAERELEERAEATHHAGTESRRSFLPPILLDREDRSARQGGLTLAVIILLIAATLTLSYLMRRPSSSGDGVTGIDTPSQLIG